MASPVEAMVPASLAEAAAAVQRGDVVAHPTEAVFGLGCDAGNEQAVARVVALKGRPADKGLIILIRQPDEIDPWIAWDDVLRARVAPTWPGPVTWILPATTLAPAWLQRDGHLAVRATAHPPARRLLQASGCPLVSTSANPAGKPPARTRRALARYYGGVVTLAPGLPGTLAQPTQIRNARTGQVLRP